jgi:hypothetical protein
MLEIGASEVALHPDAIGRILRHEIFGVVVRGVFPAEQLARVVARLEREPAMRVFESHTFRGRTYGRVLRMADESLDEYFEAARQIGPALEAAFGDGAGYEARLREIVGALGGGRSVSIPTVGGRACAPATVRVLDPGGTVTLHCGNETYAFPALRGLTQVIDASGEISTLLPLSLPEGGGELEVYDVCFGDPLIDELDGRLGRDNAHEGLADRHCLRLELAVGDLALFEEGRYYHRVNEVRGTRSRWTMGGFLAPSRDAQTLHYWS